VAIEGERGVRVEGSDLSSHLTKQVLELIRGRGLRPGDRLPTAKALAEHFGVATPTLREALRRLQATGVVDIRHGSGIYVRRDHERLMLANPAAGNLDAPALLHLLDARALIEPHLAELAARRIGPAEIAELEGHLRDAEWHLTGDDATLHRVNMAFHEGIARVAGNPILAEAIESLIELHSSEQMAILWLYNARNRDHRDHVRILDALRRGDATDARERMRRHIEDVRSVVAARLAEDGTGTGEETASRTPAAIGGGSDRS
jgi:GntR family transcriptional repressor for pyruvate dehydrogenase complex